MIETIKLVDTGHKEKDIMKKYVILAAVCWFAVISLVGIILTVYDKRIAGSGKRRIPEATLMTVGLLGAAGPMYLTMKKIRHKTKHKKFMRRKLFCIF